MIAAIVLAIVPLPVQGEARQKGQDFTFEVFLLARPDGAKVITLWTVITNTSDTAKILCRPGSGYTWMPSDPLVEAFGEHNVSIHGCGDADHDPFWMLLPGESRIDSYEIKSPPAIDVDLLAEVSIEVSTPGSPLEPQRRELSWKGSLADALARGETMKGRSAQ